MKAFFPSAVLAAALMMSACGDGRSDAAKQMASAADSVRLAASVDLSEHHLPLILQMPTDAPPPTMVWKDEIGKLEVRAGDHFALEISEGPADMSRLKADLDRDLLKKNMIVEESPELLIYRSEFPDDTTLVFYHFNRSISADGRFFLIQDTDDGNGYTLDDIRQMAATVQVKNPA